MKRRLLLILFVSFRLMMMIVYMPLLLGYFALTFASGLSIYFITSNILGIIQYAMRGKANWQSLIPGFLRSK